MKDDAIDRAKFQLDHSPYETDIPAAVERGERPRENEMSKEPESAPRNVGEFLAETLRKPPHNHQDVVFTIGCPRCEFEPAGMPQSPAPTPREFESSQEWKDYRSKHPTAGEYWYRFAEAYAASLRGELEATRQQNEKAYTDGMAEGQRSYRLRAESAEAANTRLKEALQNLWEEFSPYAEGACEEGECKHSLCLEKWAAFNQAEAVLSSKAPQETK